MKKTLLLSVVASTMIMAGGDIAPVEPVVETPMVAEASGWDFGGKGVVYYQTNDTLGISGAGPVGDLFAQASSSANAGIQLNAVNKDLFAGIGAGVELSGLATLGLENDVVSNVMQSTNGALHGGWISQSYLTMGAGATSLKVGRQTLPKSLSPMAYSEDWNVFSNTFDAALLVNSSLPNTTLVAAWVYEFNTNGMAADMAQYNKPNGDRGIWMLTAQNKSVSDLTLTGTVYYAPKMLGGEDLTILWGDAGYNVGNFGLSVQANNIDYGSVKSSTSAYGAKITGSVMGLNAAVAYTSSDHYAHQVGGSTSAMYTTTALDQVKPKSATWTNEDKLLVSASTAALGGSITGVFANSTNDHSDYNEFDLVYSTNLTDSVNLTAAYVYADLDALADPINLVRVVGSYKF